MGKTSGSRPGRWPMRRSASPGRPVVGGEAAGPGLPGGLREGAQSAREERGLVRDLSLPGRNGGSVSDRFGGERKRVK